MRKLTINGDLFHIPQTWNELTPDQFLRIAELSIEAMPVAEFRLKLFLTITGLRVSNKPEVFIDEDPCYYLKHGKTNEYLVSVVELTNICKLMDFLFEVPDDEDEEKERVYRLHSKLTKQLLPEIKHRNEVYTGAADGLNNLLFAEYIHLETAYVAFNKTRKQQFLNRMVAILYRPYRQDDVISGDNRMEFNDALLDRDAQMMDSLEKKYKNAVFLWYEGCRNFLGKTFPEVFYSGESGGVKRDTFESFLYLVNALTDNDVTKTEAVRRSYLYEVMVTLNQMALTRKEFNRKLKK